jgi:PAS domain-containing protein
MKFSSFAKLEAFSGDGPAAIWANERRREARTLRRPVSFSGLIDRHGSIASEAEAPPVAAQKQTPLAALFSLPLAQVLPLLPGAIALLDRDMIIRAASRGWIEELRLNAETEVVGRSFYDFFEDGADYWQRQLDSVLGGSMILREHDSFERPDGFVVATERSLVPVRGNDGEIVGLMMVLAVAEAQAEAVDHRNREVAGMLVER